MKDKLPTLDYFAGLFDGEGSISISLSGARARKRPLHVLVCIVAMCDENVIRLLARRFGGDVGVPKLRKKHWRQQWRWRVSGAQACWFLEQVEPYMVVKQKQAQLGIEFYKAKRRFRTLPIEELRRREGYRQRLWELNGSPQKKTRRELDWAI